ncbi:MAG: CDP-diacylglycerol--serine O-phosphatidyltransferase [Gemmataceae bacterium]
MKTIAIIPTLLTLGNAVCGFAAIAYASKIDGTLETEYYFALSGWLIFAAMIFDALDGYVARLSRSASKFGGELDSLCDAISFGIAPAFLLMRMGPGWEPRPLLHQALAGIATLYMACTLLRLARFNVENSPDPASHKRFRGLPSPAAGGCLASLAILRYQLPQMWGTVDPNFVFGLVEVWAMIGALLVAMLMVSQVPYPHLGKILYRGRWQFHHLVQILLLGFIIVILKELALTLIFWSYALIFLLRFVVVRSLRPQLLEPVTSLDKGLRH